MGRRSPNSCRCGTNSLASAEKDIGLSVRAYDSFERRSRSVAQKSRISALTLSKDPNQRSFFASGFASICLPAALHRPSRRLLGEAKNFARFSSAMSSCPSSALESGDGSLWRWTMDSIASSHSFSRRVRTAMTPSASVSLRIVKLASPFTVVGVWRKSRAIARLDSNARKNSSSFLVASAVCIRVQLT